MSVQFRKQLPLWRICLPGRKKLLCARRVLAQLSLDRTLAAMYKIAESQGPPANPPLPGTLRTLERGSSDMARADGDPDLHRSDFTHPISGRPQIRSAATRKPEEARSEWRREAGSARTSKDREFAARVARRVYVDREPQNKVAASEGITVTKVSRLLRYAEDHAIVKHVIDQDGRPWVRDDLAQKLIQQFGLSYGIVVDTGPLGLPEYQPTGDDRLHHLLGKALGEYLRLIVRNGDHVLTVGGRGPFFVAQHLATFYDNLTIRDVNVTAISGKMATQVHDPTVAFAAPSVDADDAAFFLAKAFCADMARQFHPLNRQVAYPAPEGYTDRKEDFRHLFSDDGTLRNRSTLCVCGVGRLGGNHMFIRREERNLQHIAAPIADLLSLLASYKDSADHWAFFPIGDIANRLFLTREISEDDLKAKVIAKISDINRSIVGLTFSQLALVPNIIVLAGGHLKYPAIRKVLSFQKPTGEPFVSVLCTDVEVAVNLIKDGPEQPRIDVSTLPGE